MKNATALGACMPRTLRASPCKLIRNSETCRKCHLPQYTDPVQAAGGFIDHQDVYQDLNQSKHRILDCVDCHNPHEGVVALKQAKSPTTETECKNCHFRGSPNPECRPTHGNGAPLRTVSHATHYKICLGRSGKVLR